MRWISFGLLGLVTVIFLFNANVWEGAAGDWWTATTVSLLSLAIAVDLLWVNRPNSHPFILFFAYISCVATAMMGLQTDNPPVWATHLLMPLSMPVAAYAIQPFERTRQWRQLSLILLVVFGSYALYQVAQAQQVVSGWTYTIFYSGFLLYLTFVIKHQQRMSPKTTHLLMAIRFFSVGVLPLLLWNLTLRMWIGEAVMLAEMAFLGVVFVIIGFIILHTNNYSKFANRLNQPLIALIVALTIYGTHTIVDSYVNIFLTDLILTGLITSGVLIAAPWQRQIIREMFGAGELSADFMQSVANHLAPPTYDNIQQVVIVAAESLQVQHITLIARNAKQQWFTLAALDSDSIEVEKLRYFTFMHLVDAGDSLPNLPTWVRLIVPLRGEKQTLGWLLLSAPQDTDRFHERQLLQIGSFVNLLLNAVQTIITTEREAFFAIQTVRGMGKTRHEIGTRLHAELLDALRRLEHQLMSSMGDSLQLVREIQTAVRDILHELYPVDLDQDVESITIATLALYKSANFSIRPAYNNLDHCHLPREQRLAVFFILREALNNIRLHSCAMQVSVTLTVRNGFLSITIFDNGQAPATFTPGYGLTAMDYWTRHYGGDATFTHQLNVGTTVCCTMRHGV